MTDTRKQVEREIAEWLLDQSLIATERMVRAETPDSHRNFAAAAVAMESAASIIERGEYRKDEA